MKNSTSGLVYTILLLASFFAVSCSSESYITFNPDLSGKAVVDMYVSDILFNYYQDITGNYDSETVFNLALIRSELERHRGLTVSSIALPDTTSLKVHANFENINTILKNELIGIEYKEFVSITNLDNGRRKLSLNLTENNIRALMSLGFISNNILSEYLLPAQGTRSNPENYRDDLIWALEEYERPHVLNRKIDSSHISFVIEVPNKPLSVSEDAIITRNNGVYEATLRIPVLNFLTMTTHEEFFIVY